MAATSPDFQASRHPLFATLPSRRFRFILLPRPRARPCLLFMAAYVALQWLLPLPPPLPAQAYRPYRPLQSYERQTVIIFAMCSLASSISASPGTSSATGGWRVHRQRRGGDHRHRPDVGDRYTSYEVKLPWVFWQRSYSLVWRRRSPPTTRILLAHFWDSVRRSAAVAVLFGCSLMRALNQRPRTLQHLTASLPKRSPGRQ